MAVVELTILEGRDAETLERLHREIAEVVMSVLGAQPQQVRTIVREVNELEYAVGGRTLAALAADKEPTP